VGGGIPRVRRKRQRLPSNGSMRMLIGQIECMFENFNDYYRKIDRPINIRFQWHGGEPLPIEPEQYRRIFEVPVLRK